jgi:hypothetical protein
MQGGRRTDPSAGWAASQTITKITLIGHGPIGAVEVLFKAKRYYFNRSEGASLGTGFATYATSLIDDDFIIYPADGSGLADG